MEGLIYLAKIRINYDLKTNDETIKKEILGIKNNNVIVFKDNDYTVNIQLFDNQIIMRRENNEAILEISLGNINKCVYLLKQYKNNLELDIKLIELKINDLNVYFKYELNDEIKEFNLKYEVIK